jgi:hypothetical protein
LREKARMRGPNVARARGLKSLRDSLLFQVG